ncbi:MAG TPA: MFS transporter [Gemmatimonadaceae bacterium]|nr:MFS transporter [Gemmatimonadaceae bacterium]
MTRQRLTLVATIVASAMTFIDGTVVNVALPALQRELGATITDVQWVVEAYALFLGALLLVGGSLGDQFGRKRIFLIGVFWFTAASALCGVAANPRFLIVGRALQGIGAALLVPGSLAIISATFDGAQRGRAIGTWSGFSAITTAIGPVVGGWLIDHVSWRAAFFINVPLAAVVIFLSFRYVDESRDPSRTGRVDWMGGLLAVIALGGIVLGLLEWPPLGPGHPVVVGSLVVGVIALVLLIVAEHREKSPMMPLGLFASRAFSLANLLTLLLYGALGIVMFLVPLLLIQVMHYSATEAGAAFLPFPIIMFALSRWSGGLVARTGPRLPLTVGPAVAAVGLALFARVGGSASYWTGLFPAATVLGLGMAITVAPLTTTVMTAVASDHAGTASGINNTVARVAALLAIAVFGVVLTRSFEAKMQPTLAQPWVTPQIRSQLENEMSKMAGAQIDSVALDPTRRAVIQGGINESFLSGFRLVVIEAAVLALVAAGFGAGVSGSARELAKKSKKSA